MPSLPLRAIKISACHVFSPVFRGVPFTTCALPTFCGGAGSGFVDGGGSLLPPPPPLGGDLEGERLRDGEADGDRFRRGGEADRDRFRLGGDRRRESSRFDFFAGGDRDLDLESRRGMPPNPAKRREPCRARARGRVTEARA
mmetsp:Transcript_12830/g.33298  ORF Transcript_12830/g.33298 Transcript_12830/m.33298 type:complete len:142 (-) Transcript_12830:48-473(-)